MAGPLREQNRKLRAQVQSLQAEVKELRAANHTLNQKVSYLVSQLFGRTSEVIDRRQLELLLGQGASRIGPETPLRAAALPPSGRVRRPRPRRPRLPEDLPTEEILIDPEEVQRQPQRYRCIGQEITQELDVIPPVYFRRRFIRRKWQSKAERDRAPLIAALPPRLIEGGYASPGILTDIILKKYRDHLPLYRQEQILRERHGIELARQTMSDWVREVAEWLRPIYEQIRERLQRTGYLQIDESPVRYLFKEGGGSGQGYLWVYHHPPPPGKAGAEVLYEWHLGRGADCLQGMLDRFHGTVQCDGHGAYHRYLKGRNQREAEAGRRQAIELVGCWAHARRKFHEALEEAPSLAAWYVNQIGQLYAIESRLRQQRAGRRLREAVRAAQTQPVLRRLRRAMRRKLSGVLPRSRLGEALGYTLGHWEQLRRYGADGRLEIDNNLVENAIRPTAVGKKNYLFFGHPEAGQRSAILYTILENCQRCGVNPQEYLRDVLGRLPSMKIQQVGELTPAAWARTHRAKAA